MNTRCVNSNTAQLHSPFVGIVLTATLAVLTAACGTTSTMQKPQPTAQSLAVAGDLSGYSELVVLDFADKVSEGVTSDKQKDKAAEMAVAGKHFADLIAAEVRSANDKVKVARSDHGQPNTVMVSGEITRLEEGSGTLRFMIGFGAGSAYFDATVRITDGQTGALFGTMSVDKNSWALGGALAGSQSVESFMQGAAKKIADELQAANLASDTPAAGLSDNLHYAEVISSKPQLHLSSPSRFGN